MEVSIRDLKGVTVVTIKGSVDALSADGLTVELAEQVESGRIHLVADFSGVEYISSAGLRAILATAKQARQSGGDFRLAALRPNVQRIAELSGFTTILKFFGEMESAVASYGPEGHI